MDDETGVCRFQGRPAVLRGFRGDEGIEAVVGTRVLIFHRADWQVLPRYDGAGPAADEKAE